LADGGRHLGDVSYLTGASAGEGVDVVRQILPGAGDTRHHCLPAELAFRTHLSSDARHLVSKGSELVDHGVHGRSNAEKLALNRFAIDFQHHLLPDAAFADSGSDPGALPG